jgi:hypothetical protein
MVLSDGRLGEDASMADFEERLSRERIKRRAFENLNIFFFCFEFVIENIC